MDNRLITLSDQLGTFTSLIVLSMITVAIIFPPFAAVVAVLGVAFLWMHAGFHPVQTRLKMLDNETATPLFSHLTASIQGLSTIHAFQKMAEFQLTFFRILNVNSRAVSYFYDTQSWLAYVCSFFLIFL